MDQLFSKQEKVITYTNSLDGSWHVVQVINDYTLLGIKFHGKKKEEVRPGRYQEE